MEQLDRPFQNIAAVNGWDADVKLQWLKVRLMGKAQAAFKKFTETDRETYDATVKKLKEHFEPSSKRELHLAELPLKKKKHSESWGDFADDLRTLVDRAYPDLDNAAQEQLTLTYYLAQITNPQVAFGVKQTRPKTVNDAVVATMETEAFLPGGSAKPLRIASMDVHMDEPVTELTAAVQNDYTQPRWVRGLTERLDKLERNMQQLTLQRPARRPASSPSPRPRRNQTTSGRSREVKCWNCGKVGHYARGCAAESERPSTTDQGN